MPPSKLPNYLRLHRKRAGFSEEEIAYLLGLHDAARVSRYEHFHTVPSLTTALAYHVIFRTAPPELFGGKFQKVERQVRRRAKRLLRRLAVEKPGRVKAHKLDWLRMLAGEGKPIEQP